MSSHHPADVSTMMFPLIIFLTAFCLGQCTSCTAYSFDTANVAHLYVQDNSIVTFTFSVRYDTACGANAKRLKSVEISEQKQSSGIEARCIFNHENGNCIPPLAQSEIVCFCNPEEGWYAITGRLFRDSGDRKLTVYGQLANGKAFDTTVMVHIFEPAVISSLTVRSNNKAISEDSPAIPNSTVSITCLWDKGRPGQSAVLKKDNVVLDAAMSTGPNDLNRVEHVIHNVQCHDTGMVSCELTGARENKTQMLLVKCDPKFGAGNISILATSELHTVHFPVTAYDRNIRGCELLKYDLSSGTYGPGNVDCVRIASLKGSVPNLNLTIQLLPWVKNMGGRWRLDLTNNGGKGSVYFTIQLVEEENREGLTIHVLSAVITGPVLVAVNVIALFIICFKRRKKRGKISRLPPPPAPHTFRRVAPDAVMFHVQPAGQGHRDSFISVRDHIYCEIPGDSETSDQSVQSHASSPLSEGSLSEDFLRNIACPSSNSSLLDDDPARPNVPASSLIITTATVHPTPKTDGVAAMTIADSWGEPPHDRNAMMLPTSGSIFSEDASHPRVSCADELKTATTVHTGEEEAAVTPAAAWAEPLYENNISIPPCHTLNDDYLQPIVSTLARERPGPPANMSAGTMSTASDGAPQRESTTEVSAPMLHNSLSDDYLHPIASVLEGARPATQARSDRPTQGRTASASTASDVQPQEGKTVTKPQPHNNLPDQNLHPVSAALDKKTTAKTVQPKPPGEREAVYEPPYENTMEMSPRLLHSTLPDDYLHPVTSTQDLSTSIIELSSLCLTSRASTKSRSDPPYENTRGMSPSLSDNTLTDDYLHPVASTTEAATTTTVTNSPCLVTPTNTDSTDEPPYTNIQKSPLVSED